MQGGLREFKYYRYSPNGFRTHKRELTVLQNTMNDSVFFYILSYIDLVTITILALLFH